MNDHISPLASQGHVISPDRRPVKRQKVAIACDVCRAKKVKCDGLRPVCSPCAKRADRGVPCEYTSEVRTSHGPSKGYVHHLESKLRELQNSTPPSNRDASAERPQLFSAINKPRQLESAWSTSPPVPTDHRYRQPSGYTFSDGRSNQPSPTSSNREGTRAPFREVNQSPFLIGSEHSSTLRPNQPGAPQYLEEALANQTHDAVNAPVNTVVSRALTASALRGSMEAPSPPLPLAPPTRPLLLKRMNSQSQDGQRSYHSQPYTPNSSNLVGHISTSFVPTSGRSASGRSSSFVGQIRSAIDSRFQFARSTSNAPPSRSPLVYSQRMDPGTQSPQSVDYVLPSRKTADNLFRVYWDTVHPLFPFLNRKQFEESYAGIWSGLPSESDESLMMCTLNVVFALASQYSETILIKERETSASKFFDRAQDLLNLDLWGVGSVDLVQCLLLMGQYLQSINSLHQCWTIGGLATRVAEGLGLHLPETSTKCPDIRQREHLRRLWHGCILLDRILSLQFSRPAMVDKSSARQVPLPVPVDDQFLETGQPSDRPAYIAFYVSSLEAFEILSKAQKLSAAIEDQELDHEDQYRLLFGHSDHANVSSVLELDQELSTWYRQLPSHLQIAPETRLVGNILQLQSHITRFRYLHARILIFRPVLSRFCLTQNELSNSTTLFHDSLPQRIALSCSTLCFRAAHEMIMLIHDNLDNSTLLGNVPLFWNCVFYTYTSATVLQAARLRPLLENSIGDYTTETSWSKAIAVLKNFERFGFTAQRAVVALEILADKVTEAVAPHGRAETAGPAGALPTPAPSTWTNPSVGQTPAPLPTAVENDPVTASMNFTGLGEPFDPSEFDFDLTDMSWLASAPVDL